MGLLKKLQEENRDNSTGESPDDVPDLPPAAAPDQFSSSSPSTGERRFPRAGQSIDPKPDSQAAQSKASAESSTLNASDQNSDSAKASTGDAAEKAGENDFDENDMPPELYMLAMLLRTNDWTLETSNDPNARAKGQAVWSLIEFQIQSAVDAGYGVDVHRLWRQFAPAEHTGLADLLNRARQSYSEKNASEGHSSLMAVKVTEQLLEPYIPLYRTESTVIDVDATEVPDHAMARARSEPFSDPYSNPAWPKRPQFQANPNMVNQPDVQQQQTGHGGMSGDLLNKVLSAPFALTAAAGSLVVNSLKAIGDKAKSYYVKNRVNGHGILAAQLDQAAAEIESLTTKLKTQGMGDLINEMRATGRPAREIFEGMKPGGSHQYFSDRFNALMTNPQFAENYGKLQSALDDFSFKATRYAASGVELNLDYSDAIDRNLERISVSTEGFVFKKDGVIKHLQELARQIGERISNLVNSLMGRLAPQ